MPKRLRTSDKILFVLNFFGDFLEEDKDPLGIFSSSYKSIFSFTGNRRIRNHFQQSLYRLVARGLVGKQRIGQHVYIKLTSAGKNKLMRSHPNLNYRPHRRWDGFWRIVSFDVDEPYRNVRGLLRSVLKDFGFAKLQQSLYICPHKVEEELRSYLLNTKLDRFVKVFVSKEVEADSNLAASLWSLGEINERYRKSLKDYEVNGNLPLLRERYLETASLDPYLPKELLPDDWLGEYLEKKALSH